MKILHHDDADGRGAASIISIMQKNRNKEDFIELNYSDEIPYERISKNELVYIVDYSFSNNEIYKYKKLLEITNNIIWIDHHQSSYDMLKNNKELIDTFKGIVVPSNKKEGLSGIALAYIWYYMPNTDCTIVSDYDTFTKNNGYNSELPIYIELLSDYDTWQKTFIDSERFSFAIYGNEEAKDPTSTFWVQLFNQSLNNNEKLVQELIEEGTLIEKYKMITDKDYIDKYGYEVTLGTELGLDKDYNCMAVNTRSNSLIFGNLIDNYDAVICYWSKERSNKFEHSIFTVKDDVNCGKIAETIAEYLGCTGGGHKGAAGFVSDEKVI